MKANIAIFLFCAYLATPTIAADKADECEEMDAMAESVMNARQAGVPMSKLYKIGVKGNDYASNIYKMIVDGAYKETRFSSPEYQEKAVTDYRNLIFQACINQRDKKS